MGGIIMKQFSLEEYIANPNKKLVTRDGRKVKRILCTDAKGPYPIVALIERSDKTMDIAIQYTKDGRFFNNDTDEKDLFFAAEKHEGWVNVYKTESGDYVTGRNVHINKEHAEALVGPTCVSTIKLEWEE